VVSDVDLEEIWHSVQKALVLCGVFFLSMEYVSGEDENGCAVYVGVGVRGGSGEYMRNMYKGFIKLATTHDVFNFGFEDFSYEYKQLAVMHCSANRNHIAE
jgi:hypothetical protein